MNLRDLRAEPCFPLVQPIALVRRGNLVDKAGCVGLRRFAQRRFGRWRGLCLSRLQTRFPKVSTRRVGSHGASASGCGMTLARGTERLETERLVLRRVARGDLPFYVRIHGMPEVAQGLWPEARPRTAEQTETWLRDTLASYEALSARVSGGGAEGRRRVDRAVRVDGHGGGGPPRRRGGCAEDRSGGRRRRPASN